MNTRPPISRQITVGVVLLIVVALIAYLGSQATIPNTNGWYSDVEKVTWSPPNAVFGPAWTVLYLLIAIAGWLVWRAGWRASRPNRARKALTLYGVQLALNGIWTPVFFAGYPIIGSPAWWAALGVIVALIVTVIWFAIAAWRWSKVAAWFMVPYVLWLGYATTLNAGIIVLN